MLSTERLLAMLDIKKVCLFALTKLCLYDILYRKKKKRRKPMKKTIFLAVVLVLSITTTTHATDESIIIDSALASSAYTTDSWYSANNAIDRNISTIWAGGRNEEDWWIQFDTGEENNIKELHITWLYSPSRRYIPTNYEIQISNDSANWSTLIANIDGTTGARGVNQLATNTKTRYVRLYIYDVSRIPALKELEAYRGNDIPNLIRFQGVLGDASGLPLETQSINLTFKIYNTELGGEALWTEEQSVSSINGTLVDGLLDVELGSVTEVDLAFDEQYYLGITVEGDPDGEMTPRFKLTSVPYAFRSEE